MLQAVLAQYREDRWDIKHFSARGYTVCYLPCSSGNSPTGSDNLDQSVGSMNPHLPGAQDKISRPSQVVRDWRHEITFSVFDSLLSQQTQRRSRRDKKKKWGSYTRYTLPSHPFAAELRHQLWWCAVLSEPRTRMRNTHSLKTESTNFMDTHVLAKLSRCSRTNKSKPPT